MGDSHLSKHWGPPQITVLVASGERCWAGKGEPSDPPIVVACEGVTDLGTNDALLEMKNRKFLPEHVELDLSVPPKINGEFCIFTANVRAKNPKVPRYFIATLKFVYLRGKRVGVVVQEQEGAGESFLQTKQIGEEYKPGEGNSYMGYSEERVSRNQQFGDEKLIELGVQDKGHFYDILPDKSVGVSLEQEGGFSIYHDRERGWEAGYGDKRWGTMIIASVSDTKVSNEIEQPSGKEQQIEIKEEWEMRCRRQGIDDLKSEYACDVSARHSKNGDIQSQAKIDLAVDVFWEGLSARCKSGCDKVGRDPKLREMIFSYAHNWPAGTAHSTDSDVRSATFLYKGGGTGPESFLVPLQGEVYTLPLQVSGSSANTARLVPIRNPICEILPELERLLNEQDQNG